MSPNDFSKPQIENTQNQDASDQESPSQETSRKSRPSPLRVFTFVPKSQTANSESVPLKNNLPEMKKGQMRQNRPPKRDVTGWIILDKDIRQTSTHAVAVVKRLLSAKKAGHAGTLDPLATGILPIALGDATKTVPFIMDSQKTYVFTVTWGMATDTDDTEGTPIAHAEHRPSQADVAAILPRYIGEIQQLPPKFSALKIEGERAYDLARQGIDVVLQRRTVTIESLTIVEHTAQATTFEVLCGKGTYVRSLARDFGQDLGCYGHISALRRTRVGPFSLDQAVNLDTLAEYAESEKTAPTPALKNPFVQPVDMALLNLPRVVVPINALSRVRRGLPVYLRENTPTIILSRETLYAVEDHGHVIAIGHIDEGEFITHRTFS
jgi:tRNA pseudouridine55 synthase